MGLNQEREEPGIWLGRWRPWQRRLRSARWALALAGGLWALAVMGCGRTAQGELSPAMCSDGIDNDGDEKTDCLDPDCRSLVLCGQPPEMEFALIPREVPNPAPTVATMARPPLNADDGSVPGIASDEDAGRDEMPAPRDSCERISCPVGERCVGGACIKPVDAGNMMLRQIAILPTSATIASRRNTMGDCFDDDCPTVGALCLCLPDPYVEIRRNDEYVDKTEVVTDSLSPIWDEAAVAVSYAPEDRLSVVVLDRDEDGDSDELIFACDLDPPAQGFSRVSCAGPTQTGGTSTVEVSMTALRSWVTRRPGYSWAYSWGSEGSIPEGSQPHRDRLLLTIDVLELA